MGRSPRAAQALGQHSLFQDGSDCAGEAPRPGRSTRTGEGAWAKWTHSAGVHLQGGSASHERIRAVRGAPCGIRAPGDGGGVEGMMPPPFTAGPRANHDVQTGSVQGRDRVVEGAVRAADRGVYVADGLAGAELRGDQPGCGACGALVFIGSRGRDWRDHSPSLSLFQDSGVAMKDWLTALGMISITLVLLSLLIPSWLLARDDRRERQRTTALHSRPGDT